MPFDESLTNPIIVKNQDETYLNLNSDFIPFNVNENVRLNANTKNSFERQTITLFTSEFLFSSSFGENLNNICDAEIYDKDNEEKDVNLNASTNRFNEWFKFDEDENSTTEYSLQEIKKTYGEVLPTDFLHNDSQEKKSFYIDIETKYDGDCFFHSITKLLPEKYANAQEVRNAVVNYCYTEAFEWTQYNLNILASAGELSAFLGDHEQSFTSNEIDSYMSIMKDPGVWVDEFWVAAVAKMEHIRLELYTPEGKFISVYGKENKNLKCDSVLIYTGDHYYVRKFMNEKNYQIFYNIKSIFE